MQAVAHGTRLLSGHLNKMFTHEQNSQLEEWKARLGIVQNEIRKATETLENVLPEIETKTKYLKYLEDNIVEAKEEVTRLDDLKVRLREEVEISSSQLTEHKKKTHEHTAILESKYLEYSDKINKFGLEQQSFNTEKEEHQKSAKALLEERLLVEKARDAFLSAAESVRWK